uniref:TRUD domain-containing protein n=1 Tax=Macrostomum lignano TaxID=282301 RepID=A0A1I8I1R8_9PLAT
LICFQFQTVLFGIRAKFPGVSQLATEDLAESLQAADDGAAGGSGKTLLLDSRAPEEFAVSHLPNAINVDYKDPAAALQIVRETSELTDSSDAAASQSPPPSVANLEGSIFKWANESRPMVDGSGRPTEFAHPYSSMWGRLLRPEVPAEAKPEVTAEARPEVPAEPGVKPQSKQEEDFLSSKPEVKADVKPDATAVTVAKNADADADVDNEDADEESDEDPLAHRPFAEADVGIETYLGSHPGFAGALKTNWEDFHVHEVDSAGCLARLTNQEIPKEVKNAEDVLTSEQKQQLLKLSLDNCAKLLNDEVVIEFPALCSNTAERNGVKVILVKQKRGSEQERREWPKDRGAYCHFVMHLHGKGTLNAIDNIARGMRMKPSHFAYCGTKDKRAVTSQWVSVHKDVQASSEDIASSVASLKSAGFVNYFGLQRFGQSGNGGTFEVGRALLRCQWSLAIDRILEPCGADNPTARRWKLAYKKDGDAATCAAKMRTGLERSLLLGIARNGGQANLSALQALPRNMLQLFGHSYQSLLWNRLATARLKLYGPKPALGDLVQLPDGSIREIGGDQPGCPADPDSCELASVVLPLPGFDVRLPGNAIADALRDMLAEDGLTLADLRHRVKDLSLPGSYRPLIVRPQGVSYSLLRYTDPRLPLLLSDRDLLNKPDQQQHQLIASSSEETGDLKSAILLRMRLPKSAYATMAVRELSRGQISVLSCR